ncbi:M16 family metallopeptidase [Roseateles toxinivorans]|uniref:Putative Zn-dependent peptidase n=1 Tax=Roseateles toxinivorans TaxID=270368 RepID=A0A4R6QRY3_9BURK|nr:pitrilysin family protein [Roseateles toxinivorans]TDP72898.1 putative Zn-dependent peptidase [Roseateles toxinivorans]
MNSTAPRLATLSNGLRAVAIEMPWRATVSLSVFIRTGSLHESARLNGISHVVEHMAFKGTATRDCQRINLDAERLGAEVNAHTDKDHTAFHLEGLPGDLDAFVAMLADIVLNSSFPADELERERRVIAQEFSEFDDDPTTVAFQLFDRACYGASHPAGRPIIGTQANILRFSRKDLLDYAKTQYTASNVVVAVAGPVKFEPFVRAVEAAFGAMPAGIPNEVAAPAWLGGLKTRRMAGSGQCQAVLGFEAPALDDGDQHVPFVLAAALLGEGMSSPLLDEIRERRGLAYHAACTADIGPLAGQFVIEGSTAPAHAEEFLTAVAGLLRQHADGNIDAVGLERARKQLTVRALRALEQPSRQLETAAQDLFTFGRLRDPQRWLAHLQAVTAQDVHAVFVRLLDPQRPVAIALTGSVPARARERAEALFA